MDSDSMLGGGTEFELDPDIVSEEAGRLYTELQCVIEAHGSSSVECLLPALVSVLESLARTRAQLRERENEAEREKEEREALVLRFEAERGRRRESEEKYLELDDVFEQERRAMRGRERERERRERALEQKAREQADQLVAMEEQKSALTRELSALRHTHSKVLRSYRDLLEKPTPPGPSDRPPSPARGCSCSMGSEVTPDQGYEEAPSLPQVQPSEDAGSGSAPAPAEPAVAGGNRALDRQEEPEREGQELTALSPLHDIISSTPELALFGNMVIEASTPKQDIPDSRSECRNTESLFAELSGVSREYLESVDMGVSLHGSVDQLEEILSQYEELKSTHELVDTARRALISRVEELTNERAALSLEVGSAQETVARLEGKLKEMEEEVRRLRKELDECQSEDPEASLPLSLRQRFSRSEMARVVMERNQYKEKLIDLQDALRRTQQLRATREEKTGVEEKKSVWRSFHRLFGLKKDPLAPPTNALKTVAPPLSTAPPLPATSTIGSSRQPAVNQTHTSDSSPESFSPRLRRRELYRDIRSHVWSMLGKRQIHGWSVPPAEQGSPAPPSSGVSEVPALVQLRLLDQKDSTSKLTCAAAVTPDISGDQTCSVWVVSGPPSWSDVTVIDPAQSNHVVDHFTLPPTSPALCIAAVPPAESSPSPSTGTVWIGTQDGSVLVHPAAGDIRRCLQSVTLREGVHSITHARGLVIAGLADGTLAFFSRGPDGSWDLQSHGKLSLGPPPVQPIRCCLATGAGLWCGYWNQVFVIDSQSRRVERSFSVSARLEHLRLFDCVTGRPLQELDLTPLVTSTLGPAFLSLSPLQISSLSLTCGRLWVGTGSGAIFAMPVSRSAQSSDIPYCSLAGAQLCYHGHRQDVRFIITAPGCINPSLAAGGAPTQLVLSGGEGYINFRIGDDGGDGADGSADPLLRRAERSHMIIWQCPAPPPGQPGPLIGRAGPRPATYSSPSPEY
ncbi:LOW QUALITY PROTEIN: C-Jun-amino-terminal kinase-interacting protein 4 [Lepisosteus oculatus]|uniref:LOW QUALITY PROTEIN: C-Jun-amino-terminal kinase-interacting protein 4 n=1 Tax=Lepisosteus oculatus TaxID=7918 RepID=UPI0035F505B2